MRIGEELLTVFYEGGKGIRRVSWPDGDMIYTDGAEGGTIWRYYSNGDEFVADFKLGFHDLAADDWEILK